MELPIPLTVLTGYLGSGKTTLLKALLRHPEMAGTAVIVNEFGEVGLDDALIRTAAEETVLLPSGCVCCAVRGDLVESLRGLHKAALWGEIPPVRRVALETTGLADPAPIAHTVVTEREVFRLFRLDAVVTTVDAQHGLGQLDAAYEPAKQIAVADRIVLTKTDVAEPAAVERLRARIGTLNPAAPVLSAVKGELAPAELFGLGAYEVRGDRIDAQRWLAAERYEQAAHACAGEDCTHPAHRHGHHHGQAGGHLHGIASFCITFEQALDAGQLEQAIEVLRSTWGQQLLRVKGLLDLAGQPQPFVIHGVQHVFYPVETLPAWPGEDRRSRIVFITRDLPESTVRAVFAPLLAGGAGEANARRGPDRADQK